MPQVKGLPNFSIIKKLIERYIKIERGYTVGEALERAGIGKNPYYKRMRSPEDFTLGELRSLAKALRIPMDELIPAIEAAVRYQ